jgi:L-fuconolactonase
MPEIIDAHHHLWKYTPEDYPWITPHTSEMQPLRQDFLPADLMQVMDSAGVSGSVVVQARQTLAETRWLLELAEECPSIYGVIGWLPLTDPQLPSHLTSLANSKKINGLRHVIQDEPDDNFILRQDFNEGIAQLRDHGLTYDILIHERHLPQATEFVKRHPEQIFVLDHLAKPLIQKRILHPWSERLQRLAESPNVYCKLSGLVTETDWTTWTLEDLRPYMDAALDAFGAERLMAGSDWPVCLLASSYQRWWSTVREWLQGVSSAQRDLILGETARRVYKLGGEAGLS